MKRIIFFLLAVSWINPLSASSLLQRHKSPDEYPEAKARIGQVFELREMDESLSKYAYKYSEKPKATLDKLDYEKYRGKRGKVLALVKEEIGSVRSYWWEVEFDDAEKRYTRWSSVAPVYLESAFFLNDLEQATKLIGSTIWINKPQKLITPARDVTVQVTHLEEVTVASVDTKGYGHGRSGFSPLWLRVKTRDGNEGLVAYTKRDFFMQNPIQPSWAAATVEAIKNRRVKIGMTAEQVRLSLGDPERINRTTTHNIVLEQWVYGRQYVYVENGQVRSFQETR